MSTPEYRYLLDNGVWMFAVMLMDWSDVNGTIYSIKNWTRV